jgi:hypothetical protein
MFVNKPYLEFHAIDLSAGWEPVGPDQGVEQKILSGGLDEANRRGSVTRLLRMLPGTVTSEVLRHEFWEEVYVMSGDYRILDKDSGATIEEFPAGGAYACRPPGKDHGPFATNNGAMLIEIRYFAEDPKPGSTT